VLDPHTSGNGSLTRRPAVTFIDEQSDLNARSSGKPYYIFNSHIDADFYPRTIRSADCDQIPMDAWIVLQKRLILPWQALNLPAAMSSV
jgi:hypothetical protein